jgi:hypothetical protein
VEVAFEYCIQGGAVHTPSRNHAQLFAVGQTKHSEIPSIQGKYRFDPFTVCQVQQRRIGQLYPQARILGQDRSNSREIRLAKSNKLKGAAMERRQELPNCLRVCAQKPSRLGNHGPTSQQGSPDVTKLLYTRVVVFVGFQ